MRTYFQACRHLLLLVSIDFFWVSRLSNKLKCESIVYNLFWEDQGVITELFCLVFFWLWSMKLQLVMIITAMIAWNVVEINFVVQVSDKWQQIVFMSAADRQGRSQNFVEGGGKKNKNLFSNLSLHCKKKALNTVGYAASVLIYRD